MQQMLKALWGIELPAVSQKPNQEAAQVFQFRLSFLVRSCTPASTNLRQLLHAGLEINDAIGSEVAHELELVSVFLKTIFRFISFALPNIEGEGSQPDVHATRSRSPQRESLPYT